MIVAVMPALTNGAIAYKPERLSRRALTLAAFRTRRLKLDNSHDLSFPSPCSIVRVLKALAA